MTAVIIALALTDGAAVVGMSWALWRARRRP